jgi:hypothetical protein
VGCRRLTSFVHQRGLRRTRRGRARAGSETGEGRGCGADRSHDCGAADAQGEARAAGSCDAPGERACVRASDQGAHACVTFSVLTSSACASTVRDRVRRMHACDAPGVCRLRWGRCCPSDRCCAPGCVAKECNMNPIPSPKVPKSETAKTGDKLSLWGNGFSPRPMAAASAPPRLPAVLALAAMFCELQLPVEPVYGRRTACTGSPWQRTSEALWLVSKA